MSLIRRVAGGVAWSTASGWLQLGLSILTFALVTRQLGPLRVGTWGIVLMIIGVGDLLTGGPLTDSVQQRKDLTTAERDATFWIGQAIGAGFAAAVGLFAPFLCAHFGIPSATPLLLWTAASLPLSAITSWCSALLGRTLGFAVLSRINLAASMVSSLAAIAAVTLGWGIASLLIGELSGRIVRAALLWRACAVRPGPPRNLGAAASLMRFNLHTFGVYALGYADASAPTLLTGALLGPRLLGYLIIAQKVLSLLQQLVLSPLSEVSMAAAARAQSDPQQLKSLVKALYWIAALMAYPVFLGAMMLTPDLARLMGAKWAPAVLTAQLLLLVGLRTTTGIFNISILRGVGRSTLPLVLLGLGLVLNLIFVPIGARFGSAGVALAIVLRTFATWPLGCWMIKRYTGVGYQDQTAAGAPALAAAMVMALVLGAILRFIPVEGPLWRLLTGAALGAAVYLMALALFAVKARRALMSAVRLALEGDGASALGRIRAELRV